MLVALSCELGTDPTQAAMSVVVEASTGQQSSSATSAESEAQAAAISTAVNSALGITGGMEAVPAWKPQGLKQTIFITLEDPNFSKLAATISTTIMGMIVMGCITYVMETMRVRRRRLSSAPRAHATAF